MEGGGREQVGGREVERTGRRVSSERRVNQGGERVYCCHLERKTRKGSWGHEEGTCPQPSRSKVSTMRSRQLALPLVFACHNFVTEEDRERRRVCTLRLPFVSFSQHRHQSSSIIVPHPSTRSILAIGLGPHHVLDDLVAHVFEGTNPCQSHLHHHHHRV